MDLALGRGCCVSFMISLSSCESQKRSKMSFDDKKGFHFEHNAGRLDTLLRIDLVIGVLKIEKLAVVLTEFPLTDTHMC